MKRIRLAGKDYTFMKGYQTSPDWRRSLNRLTRQTFGFDFEVWYEQGCWPSTCIPYSLADGEAIVSHVTVSLMDFQVLGVQKRYVQLGTVMTHPSSRNRGLSRFLLGQVLSDWRDKSDLIFLFANDGVRDFYPKFGFYPVTEHQFTARMPGEGAGSPVRSLHLQAQEDRRLFLDQIQRPNPLSALSLQNGQGLVRFYAGCMELVSFADRLLYIPALDATAVAEYEGDTLLLYEVFADRSVTLPALLAALARPGVTNVRFFFTPLDMTGEAIPFAQEDTTLFLLQDMENPFAGRPLMFPLLSHT